MKCHPSLNPAKEWVVKEIEHIKNVLSRRNTFSETYVLHWNILFRFNLTLHFSASQEKYTTTPHTNS